jgi:hypothetical protein
MEERAGFARRTNRRITARLVPFLFLLYIIAFIDRTNVASAALQMPHDLGFSDKVVGFGSGIFFFGYMLLQIPGALIAERMSVRRWISRVMVAWGLLTILMAFVHTAREFYAVRFMVGVAEAGFFPAVVVYLTHWFRNADRAKALAGFYAAMPLSFVVGSPLAGLLLKISWHGVHGWRWLFVLEGIPAIAMGIVALFYLTDWPREAKWLREDEREWIAGELEREKEAKKTLRPFSIWQALRDRNVILLLFCDLWKLRHRVLAADDFEADLGQKRFDGDAAGRASVPGGGHYATDEWLAFGSHARAQVARRRASDAERRGAVFRDRLSLERMAVAYLLHPDGRILLRLSADVLECADRISGRHGRGGLRRADQHRKYRRLRGTICAGIFADADAHIFSRALVLSGKLSRVGTFHDDGRR